MTVAELKAAIAHLPDSMRVMIASTSDGRSHARYARELVDVCIAKSTGGLDNDHSPNPWHGVLPQGSGVELEEIAVVSAGPYAGWSPSHG